jgi:hypothetical protein
MTFDEKGVIRIQNYCPIYYLLDEHGFIIKQLGEKEGEK